MSSLSANKTVETNGYALYMYSINRHHITSENPDSDELDKSLDSDQSNVCLSLLGSNVDAERETLVRCHLLKTFSVSESLGFQNEGKYVRIKIAGDLNDAVDCYYHHLVRDPTESNSPSDETFPPSKKTSFFVCLIGYNDDIMNAYCPELGIFCNQLLPCLEPEEQTNLEKKLKMWYFYCVEFIPRCIVNFKSSLILLFQSSFCAKVVVECQSESTKWDLERFIDVCSLNELFETSGSTTKDSEPSKTDSLPIVHLKVDDHNLIPDVTLEYKDYCQKWVDELLACDVDDPIRIRNILDMFRLKTVRDINIMKRLLQKAENDYYSLFKAYQFYKYCGYGDILIHHVKEEAQLMSQEEGLCLIKVLCDFINKKKEEESQ